MQRSIRTQLLFWILIPLLLLSVLSTAVTYSLALDISEKIYDEMLLNSTDSVIARTTIFDNELLLSFSKIALLVFRHEGKDDFYFKITDPQGNFVVGDQFESSNPGLNATYPVYRYGFFNGSLVRICVNLFDPRVAHPEPPSPRTASHLRRYTARYQPQDAGVTHMFVHVAETCHARSSVSHQVLMTSLFLELLSVLGGAVAVWFGVGRGLLPLRQIQEAIAKRSPGDLNELQIQHPPKELISLIGTINRVLTLLRQHVEEQASFVSNAAHELRTPLAALKTYVDLGRRNAVSNRESDLFSNLNTGVGRMSNLVNKLLALAKAEGNAALPGTSGRVDLNNVIVDSILALRSKAEGKKVDIESKLSEQPAIIRGDAQGLLELVDNLILNAIVFTPEAGRIKVSTTLKDDFVSFVVEDTGPGIPESERSKVFQRFYRILGNGAEGSGLGLAIVKKIADSHQAVVSIDSGPNQTGCRMIVNFHEEKTAPLPVRSI